MMRTIDADDMSPRPPTGLSKLFADGGERRTLPVSLPVGAVVWPDPGYTQRHAIERPAFWLSDEPVTAELWIDLRAQHRTSGLWPVLLDDSTQAWSAGQIAPEPVAEI